MNPAPASAQQLHLKIELNPENPRCIAATPSRSPVGTAFASTSPGDRRFPKPRTLASTTECCTCMNDSLLRKSATIRDGAYEYCVEVTEAGRTFRDDVEILIVSTERAALGRRKALQAAGRRECLPPKVRRRLLWRY